MTLNRFASFAMVAKHLNVRRAALELGVSQSSVSQQLKQLEDQYGLKLYRRRSKGVEITEAGKRFLRDITPIIEQATALNGGSKRRTLKAVRQVLRVGGTFSATAELLPSVLARLQQRYPDAEFECRTGRSGRLERLVLLSAMDLAVIARPTSSEALASESLGREKVVFFVRTDHRFAKMTNIAPSDLAGEQFIVRGGRGISGVTENAVKQLQDRGLAIKTGLRCDNPAAVRAAVRHGMGVGVAFENTVKAAVHRGEFAILKIPGLKLTGQLFIIYGKKRPLSPLAQECLEWLHKLKKSN